MSILWLFYNSTTTTTFCPQHPVHTLCDFNRKIKMIQELPSQLILINKDNRCLLWPLKCCAFGSFVSNRIHLLYKSTFKLYRCSVIHFWALWKTNTDNKILLDNIHTNIKYKYLYLHYLAQVIVACSLTSAQYVLHGGIFSVTYSIQWLHNRMSSK